MLLGLERWNRCMLPLLFMAVLGALSTHSQPAFDYNKLWAEARSYHGVQATDAVADKHVTLGVVLAAKGFHSQIQFTLDAQQARDHDICQMTVLQALPAGVYADPYELANIAGMSGTQSKFQLQLASYHVFGNVDVERIEPDCEPTLLSVSANISASQVQPPSARKPETLRLSVPLHARYPAPLTGRPADSFAAASYCNYSIDNPTLMLRCFNKAAHQFHDTARVCQDVCHISSVHHSLQWMVPAGLTKHAKFTQVVTFAVAVGSLSALLFAVFTGAHSRGVLNVSKQQ